MSPRRPSAAALLVLLLVTALLGTAASAGTADRPHHRATPGERATWVWHRPDPATLVRFLRAQDVADIFVSTPGDLADSPELAWFTDVRTRTAAAGIRMHTLGAEAWWVDDPEAALEWQRQALATGLFDGVHLDIEPWQHPDWNDARGPLMERYVDLLAALAADTTLPVDADISFWLDQLTIRGQRADEAVLAVVDAITMMTYRDTVTGPDSITGLAAAGLDAAQRAGKPVRLAVETNHLGDTPVDLKQTFHGESRKTLSRAMRAVDRVVGDHPTYRGIAVHDHRGWAAMRRR